MFEKRLLFLTKDLMTVYPWRKGEVSGPPRRFEATEEGRRGFVQFLSEKPGVMLHLLVDLIEEEFQVETQPHVLGPDRSALVARRLVRAFATTPFRHLFFQGREEKEGRRDDITLLSGITDPDQVMPWVACIRENRLLLVGIYSLPMVCSRLLTVLHIVSPATLVVSWQSTSGLRFSFYAGQALKMSRMAPVPGEDPGSYAQLFVSELERTRSYLASLRLVPKDVPLKVVLLTSPQMLDAVRPLCQESATITFDMVTVNAVARQLGIKRRIATPFSDSLFIQLLGRKTPENHYATAEMTCSYYSWLVRNGLIALSVVLVATAVIAGGVETVQGFGFRAGWREKDRQAKQMYVQYRSVIDQHLPTHIEPSDVRVTVQTLDAIKTMGDGPGWVMKILSRQLAGYPQLRLDSLTWRGPLHLSAQEVKDSTGKGRGQAVRQEVRRDDVAATDLLEVVTFKGEVEEIGNDVGHALEQINHFMSGLSRDPEVYQVDPVELPQVKEKVAVLAGDLMQMKKEVINAAPFSFKVIFRRKPIAREH
ncbi:MAG: hypothetical protein HQL75_16080 [Magnetococcales bacterium]|nr:hypothetical protein [Magnetococcales bacterium]